MQVGLVTGQQSLELVEMPEPQPEPGKAVVQIDYCGICGTDVHAYISGDPYNPAICGHEWTGRVSAAGKGVTTVKEGDRVAAGMISACGNCQSCRRGDHGYCQTAFASAVGVGPLAAPHGGFARAIAFEAERLYLIDAAMSEQDAAMLEPVTVAVHAVRRTDIRLGDTSVVIGAGPIGLLVLQAARAAGTGHIVLIEPQPARRALGGLLGADTLIDPIAEDAGEVVRATLGQQGADVVFECAGIPRTIQDAVNLVRRGGLVSMVGLPNLPAEIDPASWLMKEVRLTASLAYLHEEFEIAKALVADGRINCAPLHTGTVALNGLGAAFAKLADHPADIKILLDPRL